MSKDSHNARQKALNTAEYDAISILSNPIIHFFKNELTMLQAMNCELVQQPANRLRKKVVHPINTGKHIQMVPPFQCSALQRFIFPTIDPVTSDYKFTHFFLENTVLI